MLLDEVRDIKKKNPTGFLENLKILKWNKDQVMTLRACYRW